MDLLILHMLIFGPHHGQGIAQAIQQAPKEELQVVHAALCPALQQLKERHWIFARGESPPRTEEARFYSLTQRVRNSSSNKPPSGSGWILGAEGEGS